ncbi:MAG: signal peptidase I [Nanoarchaeota archaeon]
MKKIFSFLIIASIFAFGIVASIVYSDIIKSGKELPLGSIKKDGPQDYIKENQILISDEGVMINIKNAEWSRYADTHSMEPVINANANGIEIVPKCENLRKGDIVVYESKQANGLIVHRIVDLAQDEEGAYFILKGDNNPMADPEKVRCSQIKYQVIGIIY